MTVIAIMGASSQIAKDLIVFFSEKSEIRLLLYVRSQSVTHLWIKESGVEGSCSLHGYEEYGAIDHDVVINCVGVGDPHRAAEMGSSIFEVTTKFDNLILENLSKNPNRRYLFLSSGAAYGSDFLEPVDDTSLAKIEINLITPKDYYATAKLHAEVRHRSHSDSPIVDLRIFNYFSRTQNVEARFFITDIVRALRDGLPLKTSPENIRRDFMHPEDFYQLVCCILDAPPENCAVDCYSARHIDKMTLLRKLKDIYGLQYDIIDTDLTISVNATGIKPNYYSTNLKAAEFGYQPKFSSLSGILTEISSILNKPLPNGLFDGE